MDIKSLPAVPACYVLILDGKYLYVGSTEDLRARMAQHAFEVHFNDGNIMTPWGTCDRIVMKYRQSRKYGDWAMTELRLIRKLIPALNVRGVGRRKVKFDLSQCGYPLVRVGEHGKIFARVAHFVNGNVEADTIQEFFRLTGIKVEDLYRNAN
jgi:hypothetical protein